MTITAVVKGADQLRQKLARGQSTAMTLIGDAVRKEALNLVRYVKANKLTDQVLHVRTGRLRRSITARFEESPTSFRAYVGTNVKYARIHEMGFRGVVDVRSHTVKEHKRMQTTAFGRPMKTPKEVMVSAHTVKAHKMEMNMPARSFLRSSLVENSDRITTNIRKAISRTFE